MRRRRWLQLGLGAAAVLGLGGGLVASMSPGVRDGHLTAGARAVFSSIGNAVLDGVLPPSGPQRATALQGMLSRVDALVGALPPHAQAELSQLLALLLTGAGRRWLAGLQEDWPQASTSEVQRALTGMRTSGLALRQQAYQALHDIASAAYFSDPLTWSVLGYPGPAAVA